MSNRYTIEKITDIFQIPEDRFDDFLVDFKSYYQMGQPFADLLKETAKVGGINIDVIPMKMVWIDDGEHNATIRIATKGGVQTVPPLTKDDKAIASTSSITDYQLNNLGAQRGKGGDHE